jgi:HemY protein
MLKALWFIIRVGVLVTAIVLVADVPGQVRVEWQEYTFNLNLGFFLLSCAAFALLAIFAYQVLKTFIDFPKSLRRYREIRRQEKGYRALTIGLTAVAAGDTKAALAQARKARKLMPADTGLPLLLEAQAARLDGREQDAAQSFVALLENKDASFLGVRGLLQSAIDAGDIDGALALADKAMRLHPKQPWILKIVYDLQIRGRKWADALAILDKAEKYEALSREQARSDRVALHMAQGQYLEDEGKISLAESHMAKALKIDPAFVPAAARLAALYQQSGQLRKARGVVEKAWKSRPHPDLFAAWDTLIDPKHADEALARLRWDEKLLKINDSSAHGWLGNARAAMAAGLWGEARAFLKKAQAIEENSALFKLYSELEDRAGGDRDIVRDLLLKASAAKPSKVWMCTQTGRVYPSWSPVAMPHESFNTIIWDYAGQSSAVVVLTKRMDMNESLIEAPAA